MARRWHLLRHGKTEANSLDIIQGRINFPLNEEGEKQADLTAKALANVHFSHIYMSPAIRARQTAQRVFEQHDTVVLTEVTPDLSEINFGVLEGIAFARAEELYPNLLQEYRLKPSTCIFPIGESMASALARAARVVNTILINTAPNDNVLIVSHGGFLALIFVYLFDLDIDRMFHAIRHENCGLSIIELEGSAWRKSTGKPQIIRMNDVSHLLR